jgi:hypothetical protein
MSEINTATVLEQIIIDVSTQEFCFLSDREKPKYISWDNTEQFMNMWCKCQEVKEEVEISYTFRIAERLNS